MTGWLTDNSPARSCRAVDAANPLPPRDWVALLGGAELRRGVTGKTINGVYTGKEPEPTEAAPARALA